MIQELRRTPLDERVLSCAFGCYPWDDWEKKALENGVPRTWRAWAWP